MYLDRLFSSNHNIHNIYLKDFSNIYQSKGLKPKNKGHTNFYECCDLTKKVYLMYIPMYFLWYKKLIMSLSFCHIILYTSVNTTIHKFIKKSMDIGSGYWWARLIKNEHPFFYDHLYLLPCIVRQDSVKERPLFLEGITQYFGKN